MKNELDLSALKTAGAAFKPKVATIAAPTFDPSAFATPLPEVSLPVAAPVIEPPQLRPPVPPIELPPINLADDERPRDEIEELRIDMPIRTAGRIQFLLLRETPQQTAARIINDCMRYRRKKGLS